MRHLRQRVRRRVLGLWHHGNELTRPVWRPRRDARRLNARKCAHAREDLVERPPRFRRLPDASLLEIERRYHDPVEVKAEITLDANETVREKPRARDKEECERHLADDQGTAPVRPAMADIAPDSPETNRMRARRLDG